MLGELNRLLEFSGADDVLAVMPTYTGVNGFLNHVVVPLYTILKLVGFCIPFLSNAFLFLFLRILCR